MACSFLFLISTGLSSVGTVQYGRVRQHRLSAQHTSELVASEALFISALLKSLKQFFRCIDCLFVAKHESFMYSPSTWVWLQFNALSEVLAVATQEGYCPACAQALRCQSQIHKPTVKHSHLLHALVGDHACIGSHESSVLVGMEVTQSPQESSTSLKCSR